MTIEQALRWLTRRGAYLRFWLEDGAANVEVRFGGACEKRYRRTVNAESLDEKPLSVLGWQLVSLVREIEKEEAMGRVQKRFSDLIGRSGGNPAVSQIARLQDLMDLAAIVDDELAKLEQSQGLTRSDARGLVDEYGQTETKE